ncbi:MAG TPA: hypothetical protein O0X70_05345 [Methanocorpusculum sp.]|nr:hypothetical protein [Methanocorpusculum sp.]
MKAVYLIPIIGIILIALCASGCVAATDTPVSPTENPTLTPTAVQTAVPTATAGTQTQDKIIGTWKLAKEHTGQTGAYVKDLTITFNSDGTCIETDYWSDGDTGHLIGNWKKTGDNTYTYDAYRLFTLKDGALVAWFDSRTMYGSNTFVGKWEQKDEDKEMVYVEYIINADGTGTEIRKADMNGETQSMEVPLTWKDFGGGNYQVFIEDPEIAYTAQMISDNEIYEPELKDTLVRV